uniref:Uncharacterized protein n=1 Tax=Eptatretus burgeri TaxID=7764 RepID=A0A8C4QZE6_EPTBU
MTGANKFYNALEDMLGFRINPWMKLCWKFFTPLLLMGTLIYFLVFLKPLSYNGYQYPQWAEGIGWCLALTSILCVPIYALLRLLLADGLFYMRLKLLLKPENDDLESWSQIRRSVPVVMTPDVQRQSVISVIDFKLTAL